MAVYIDPEYMLEHAQDMMRGDSIYITHPDCTDKTKLKLTVREDGSVWAHCMKCGGQRNINRGAGPVEDFHYDFRQRELYLPPTLPEDFTQDIPLRSAVWFLKAGITLPQARTLGWGWSDRLRRVVLPIVIGGQLVYYQARATDGREPKYLNPSTGKSKATPVYYHGDMAKRPKVLAFTEDILSAVRVARWVPTCPLLGTTPGPEHMALLADDVTPVVWLDGDAAGQEGTLKCQTMFQWHPLPALTIHTDRDPKAYSNAEIQDIMTKGGAPI